MARHDALRAHILDMLEPLGVVARSMFGGVGFFKDGTMFGLIADERFFLKTDDSNRADYEQAGSEPFVYEGKGRRMVMPYHAVPEDVLEDPEEMRAWAQRSIAIALAAAAARPRNRPVRKTPGVIKERSMPSRSRQGRKR